MHPSSRIARAADTGKLFRTMSTLQEIKTAIASLNPGDKALLTAELFALGDPDLVLLEAALDRGLRDVKAGRVRPIEDVEALLQGWISKS